VGPRLRLPAHSWRLLPFTPLWAKEVRKARDASAPVVGLVASNVRIDNRDAQPLADFIEVQEPEIAGTKSKAEADELATAAEGA
jgi:hypothetical protein